MATVNFSVPDDVKREFDELFTGENENVILTNLMRQAIEDRKLAQRLEEDRKLAQRREAVFERIMKLRENAPTVSSSDIQRARFSP